MIIEMKLPHLGENIETGKVVNVLVETGDSIATEQPVLELETDKASIEIPAEFSGIVKKIHVKNGDNVHVGQLIITVDPGKNSPSKSTTDDIENHAEINKNKEEPTLTKPSASSKSGEESVNAIISGDTVELVPAAPSTRRFAREIGVNISQVKSSSKSGRISIEDVKAFARSLNTGTKRNRTATGPGFTVLPLPDFSKWGNVDIQPANNVRLKTAEHVSHAWTAIPHVTQFDTADITELEAQRKAFAQRAEKEGGKLTITAILLKVISAALKKFPQFNASFDLANESIILKNYYNIGIAVDTDRGLLVPVVRDTNTKNIIELSVELTELAEKTRDRKLSLEDMQGGNFTISNLGGIGGSNFTPIVNWPEVAILGVSRAEIRPVLRDDTFVPRLMMPLSLSYDHRIIDGADGARFLFWVKQALEYPFLIPLEG